MDALTGAGNLTSLDLSQNYSLSDIRPLAGLPGSATVQLFGDSITDLSPLPDSVTYTAYGQHVSFGSTPAGGSLELGIRDIRGAPVCPSFTPAGLSCSSGTVRFPSKPGSWTATMGSGMSAGDGLGMQFSLVSVKGLTFNTTYAPTVGGRAVVGGQLGARTRAWIPAAGPWSYQWRRDGKAIVGANAATLVLTGADLDARISVCVTGRRILYADTTRCSTATARVSRGSLASAPRPTISNAAVTDAVLTAVPGAWDEGVALHYRWQKNGKDITGATSSSYTVRASDVGDKLRVRVTGTEPGYRSVKTYSRSVTPARATLTTALPEISGDPVAGGSLTSVPGAWGPTPVTLSFQWYRSGKAVSGATKPVYPVTASDGGTSITVKVKGTKSGYVTASRTSAPVSVG